ncbi:hypothetical protein Tco_0682194 [Tanacetum coccineum]|uniref:Uncharacterized protein n=1 Tax=Tanacetum coccineum TaxID=301880 RepID=A0ABQ4XS34_9ASTR
MVPMCSRLTGPPSRSYIPGPEEPQSPPLQDFVPKPVYPEYMPQEDEVFPTEEQPLPTAALPTAQLPNYVPESDPKEDPEEDDNKDPKEDPADYPADGGDDGDDEDGPSDDVKDEEVDIEADDKDEEEHPALVDSTVVALPAANQAPSAEEIEPFETDESAATPPHPAYRVTARISILVQSTQFGLKAEVARLSRISIPHHTHFPWSSHFPDPSPPLPRYYTLSVSPPYLIFPSPLPVSSPVPVLSPSPPASPIRSLGHRAAMIRLERGALLPIPLPLHPSTLIPSIGTIAPSSGTPPLHLLFTDRREDRPEIRESSSAAAARPAGGLRADYGFVATMDRETRHDLERDVGYGINRDLG